MAPAAEAFVASLGLTEVDLTGRRRAGLPRRGAGPDGNASGNSSAAAIEAEGLPTGSAAPIFPDRGEEPQTIWC